MSTIKEFAEVVRLVALALHGVNAAKVDDGKVSMGETAVLLAELTPAAVKAVKGAGDIPKELSTLDKDELEWLYNEFLTILEWNPTDNTRDLFAIAFNTAATIISDIVRWRNTVRPPKAIPV